MRNLMFPLNWEEVFDYVGFPAFLKPYDGGGWKNVYHVHSAEELFKAYNESGQLCMTLQRAVKFKEYFRCYVIGQEKVHIMHYDPRAPHHERYVKNPPPTDPKLLDRVVKDSQTLCRALGYDLNTVEFAVEDGVPYAIDFMNPAPDADINSVGRENFEWVVNAVAELAVKKALSDENPARELRWASFLAGPRFASNKGNSEEEGESLASGRGISRFPFILVRPLPGPQKPHMQPTFTIGIEEEYQTVDPVTRDLRSHIHAEMIEKGKLLLQERVKTELHQSVVEVGTSVCGNIKESEN